MYFNKLEKLQEKEKKIRFKIKNLDDSSSFSYENLNDKVHNWFFN